MRLTEDGRLCGAALGADFVFVGRPFLYALAIAGEAGARHAISLLSEEIDRGLAMLGCNNVSEIGPDLLARMLEAGRKRGSAHSESQLGGTQAPHPGG